MKKIIFTVAVLFSVSIFARVPEAPAPKAVQNARKQLLKDDVRTTMKSIMNTDGNPCLSEGKSWEVEVQVRKTVRALDANENLTTKDEWETIKTVVIDRDGGVMEVCLE